MFEQPRQPGQKIRDIRTEPKIKTTESIIKDVSTGPEKSPLHPAYVCTLVRLFSKPVSSEFSSLVPPF